MFIILVLLLFFLPLEASKSSFLLMQQPQHIFVNNRILAKVNGKPISVVDLMKKMDLVFYKQFPQYSTSVEARFQFYQVNWKNVLKEMVDKELVLADAEENKLPISQGDIRQEIETLFGPHIIANLDKAGLTYEEALQLVKEDLTIKRMLHIRANSKAIRSVTPQTVRLYYEDWAKANEKPDCWKYQVVSIRGKEPTESAEAAYYAYQLLTQDIPLTTLPEKLQEYSLMMNEPTSCTLSDLFEHTQKEISESYKEILSKMKPESYSLPVAQKSKSGEGSVFRIFYLKEKVTGGAPPLQKIENRLKDQLISKAVDTEIEAYMVKLRKHFDVRIDQFTESLPDAFQPFVLK